MWHLRSNSSPLHARDRRGPSRIALLALLSCAAHFGCARLTGTSDTDAASDAAATDTAASDTAASDTAASDTTRPDAPSFDVSAADVVARDVPSVDAPPPGADVVAASDAPAIRPGALGGLCPDLSGRAGIPESVCATACPPGWGWSLTFTDAPLCFSGRCCRPCSDRILPDGECVNDSVLACRRAGGYCGGSVSGSNPCSVGGVPSPTLGCNSGSALAVCCLPAAPDAGAGVDAGVDAGATDALPDVAPDGATCSCAAPLVSCAGQCVDVANTPSHCGACGRACGRSEACVAGRCVRENERGEVLCNGALVDTSSSHANCGGCGRTCCPGSVCSQGECAVGCSSGSTVCRRPCATDTCGYVCTRLDSDETNCGGCNVACPVGAHTVQALCVEGSCRAVCDRGYANCDGNAATGCESLLDSDPRNCGACGVRCASAQRCVAGACR